MGAILIGKSSAVFGTPLEVLPLKTHIEYERARFRFRNTDFARVFLKTKTGIRSFIVEKSQDGKHFTCNESMEQGRNERRAA
jgi:hypothetical protein